MVDATSPLYPTEPSCLPPPTKCEQAFVSFKSSSCQQLLGYRWCYGCCDKKQLGCNDMSLADAYLLRQLCLLAMAACQHLQPWPV